MRWLVWSIEGPLLAKSCHTYTCTGVGRGASWPYQTCMIHIRFV